MSAFSDRFYRPPQKNQHTQKVFYGSLITYLFTNKRCFPNNKYLHSFNSGKQERNIVFPALTSLFWKETHPKTPFFNTSPFKTLDFRKNHITLFILAFHIFLFSFYDIRYKLESLQHKSTDLCRLQNILFSRFFISLFSYSRKTGFLDTFSNHKQGQYEISAS